jgi:hypothetical protein
MSWLTQQAHTMALQGKRVTVLDPPGVLNGSRVSHRPARTLVRVVNAQIAEFANSFVKSFVISRKL